MKIENVEYTRPGAENTAAAEPAENNTKKKKKEEDKRDYGVSGVIYDAVSVVVTAIALLAVVFTFGFRMVGVSGTSMVDTLHEGDWLIVTPYYSAPEYGDIVIATKDFKSQNVDGPLVKRVIGLPGDVVTVHSDYSVSVNGVKLNETYAQLDAYRYNEPRTYNVPEGCVMLMGDNRPVSLDSRSSVIGFIELEHLLGKARVRLSDNWDIYANFTPGAAE